MLYKTKGIFLHSLKYSETSLIIKVYTELFGLKTYIIKGAFRKKAAVKSNMFQPLCSVNLVGFSNKKSQLNTLKEISLNNLFSNAYSNIYKSSIILFLNEMLYHSIREEEANKELFDFIEESLVILENRNENFFNFHLVFLVFLTKYLGFQPQNNYSEKNRYFNLQEGMFENMQKPEVTILNSNTNLLLSKLLDLGYNDLESMDISSSERRDLLNLMTSYYQRHISGFKEIKSHKVLESVLS